MFFDKWMHWSLNIWWYDSFRVATDFRRRAFFVHKPATNVGYYVRWSLWHGGYIYNDGDERIPISVACNQAASWWDIWKQKGDSNDVTLLTTQQGIIWSPRITARSEIMLSCCGGAAECRNPPVLAPENTDLKKNKKFRGIIQPMKTSN